MLAVALAFVAACFGPPEPDPAQTRRLALDWEASSLSCPDRAALIGEVTRLVPELPPPQTLAAAPDAVLRVSGEIEQVGEERWEVRLRFESTRGINERRFAGGDCRALGDAAALVIAVAVDPLAVVSTITPDTGAGSDSMMRASTSSNPEREREREQEETARGALSEPGMVREPEMVREPVHDAGAGPRAEGRELPFRLGVAAFAGGGYGPISAAGFATVGAELSLFGRLWRAGVGGQWQPPRILDLPLGEVRHEGFSFDLRGCAVPSWRALEFPVCGAVELGAVAARGVGATPEPQAARLVWLALSPSAGLRWVLDERVALGLELSMPASLVRGGFRIDDTVVSRLAPVGVRGLASVELRFSP